MNKPDDLYGLTVRDLDRQMQQNWGDLAARIENFENQLRHQYTIISGRSTVINLTKW